MRIGIKREIAEDAELRSQWNALVSQMPQPEVFYTWEWAMAVQSAYSASLKPLLILGYEGELLVGVASLASTPGGKAIQFLAANTADYCDFIAAPQHSEAFINGALAELRKIGATSIALANLTANARIFEVLQNQTDQVFHSYPRPAYVCAQVDLAYGELRHQLKAATAGKKKLRRYLREMEGEGPVAFSHLQSLADVEQELPAFADAHVARFEALGKNSSLSSSERRVFLMELARRFDGQRVVTLSILRIAGRSIAWNYGFQFAGSWFWYQPTFDSSQEKNSPGYCLLSRIVTEACDMAEMKVIDLGLGAEGYKERFGNSTRQTVHLTLTSSRLLHLKEKMRHQAAGVLKRSPRVESAVRLILGR